MAGQALFISHASDDSETVTRIVDYLERHGVACWISSRDIPPQAIYAEAITHGLRDARACVVVVSASANESAAIKRELELASRYNKPFIPIRIDQVEPGPGVDYYLNNTQWMDYRRDGEKALDRIVANLSGAAPPARPAPTARRETPEKRGGMLVPALIGIAVLIAAGAGFAFWSGSQKAPQIVASSAQSAPPPSSAAPQAAASAPAAAPQSAAPQSSAGSLVPFTRELLLGKWAGTYSLNGAKYPLRADFHADKSAAIFSAGNVKGVWSIQDNAVHFTCDHPGCWEYVGTLNGDVISGRYHADNTTYTDAFEMTRAAKAVTPAAPAESPSQNVLGSSIVGKWYLGDWKDIIYSFSADGVGRGQGGKGTWRQNGDHVTFTWNGGMRWEGRLVGDKFEGDAFARDGSHASYVALNRVRN